MKKLILTLGILISLTTMARFEEQYGANEIKIEKFQDGGNTRSFTMKDNQNIYVITQFPTAKKAESNFQDLLNEIEKRKYEVLNYTEVIATKKITFIAGNQIVVISKTMDEVDQLLLDINQLDKLDKFEQYLKLNDVHGSLGLTILNAKMNYTMRDKK